MTASLNSQWIRLEIETIPEHQEILAELLWKLESTGFREYDQGRILRVEAFFQPSESEALETFVERVTHELDAAAIRPANCSGSHYHFEADSWIPKYRSGFREFSIGDTFFIHPPWRTVSPRHPVNIMIEPSLAFGTGTHESTRLALIALEKVLPGSDSMLDVGTGSGILSIAAKKLKPGVRLIAFDNDPLAVSSTLQNLGRNRVEGVGLFVGETAALKSGFDLIVANLTLAVFRLLAGELLRLGDRDLILSGLTAEQRDSVLDLFTALGHVELVYEWDENDWVCLHLKHETSAD